MADAIVYATAKDQRPEVVTGDADLKDLPGVVYISSCSAPSSPSPSTCQLAGDAEQILENAPPRA